MKKSLQNKAGILSLIAAAMSLGAFASTPVAPGNLKAETEGQIVRLTWDWGNAGAPTLTESFEGEDFTGAWELQQGTAFDRNGTWSIFDFSEKGEDDPDLTHDGKKAAILFMAMDGDPEDPTSMHQDEWLKVRPGEGAQYMDFWYYLYPQLKEDGADREFPDHYYVKISRDNGETWRELWDGRWDIGTDDAVQQASLFLGEPTDDNTIVAFQGISGPEMSLYYLWAIDDVSFLTAEQAAARDRMKAPQSEWLNAGNTTFRIYLDDEIIGDYVKTRQFVDYSSKTPGTHLYRVMAWSEEMDEEYEDAEVTVDLEEVSFSAPRNVVASCTETTEGRYDVSVRWDAPEGDVAPDHYIVNINGKMFAWVDPDSEFSAGQSGLYRGVYTLSVTACYVRPDGESEPVSSTVFPGTVGSPINLSASADGNEVTLRWEAPVEFDGTPAGYTLFRDDDPLAEGYTDIEYKDKEVATGQHTYSVHAIYADGTQSLPATAEVDLGQTEPFSLPYKEDFDNGHLPFGWELELVDSHNSVKDMYNWRFDNWFESDIETDCGLVEPFASISGIAAGMNRLECYLYTPRFIIKEGEKAGLEYIAYYVDENPGPSGAASLTLEKSVNGGEWTRVSDIAEDGNGPLDLEFEETDGAELRLRWKFTSRKSGVAAIDGFSLKDLNSNGVSETHCAGSDGWSVWTVSGIKLAEGMSEFDIQALPEGLYILKNGEKREKRVIK